MAESMKRIKRLLLVDISGSIVVEPRLQRAYEAVLDVCAQDSADALTIHAFSAMSHVPLFDPTALLTSEVPGYAGGHGYLDRVLFYFFGPESTQPDVITVITDNDVLIGEFQCPVPIEVKLLIDDDTEPVNPSLLSLILRSGGSIVRI